VSISAAMEALARSRRRRVTGERHVEGELAPVVRAGRAPRSEA